MSLFFAATIFGLYIGSAYAIAASGLVLTYTTTRVFNIAHGAISMIMAFLYWQIHVSAGVPTLPAVLIVVLVIAPLVGLILELLMRGMGDAPVSVSLVATIAVFLGLIGLATQFWPNTVYRTVPYFFGFNGVTIFGVRVGYHYLLTIVVAAAVALALYLLLNRTRIGIAMRGAVDNPELLGLYGAEARTVSRLSWALGSMLAALGGVMLAAYTGLDYYSLTFLVIAAFAAAMLGQLKSLPLTYVGALLLGLGGSYIQVYLSVSTYLQIGLTSALPTFLLFAILIFVPQVRLRVGQVRGIVAARVPGMRQSLISAVVVFAVALTVVPQLSSNTISNVGLAVCYAIVLLSMVLLTGYGGYMSLAQFTFVGIGATTVAKMHNASPESIVLGVLLAAIAGAIVSVSVLRLNGLYLALATLAFGQLCDKLIFSANFLYGQNGSMPVGRSSFFGISFHNTTFYVLMMLVVFLILGLGLLKLRRGPIGRLLIALRDSPAACATVGLNSRWFRVAVFTASAAIAGLAGGLLAGLQELAAPQSFATLSSLPTVLAAVVAGVTTVSGALVGGFVLMGVLTATGATQGTTFILLAVGAFLLARDPNGMVSLFYRGVRWVTGRLPGIRDFVRRWGADTDRGMRRELEQGLEVEDGMGVEVAEHGVA
jgi:branched-chain amino acid transport system permease protein